MKFSNILLPAVVLTPWVQNKSLTAIGTPGNKLSRLGFLSKFLAFSKAWSEQYVINEFNFFPLLIFFIKDWVSSSDFISFFFN
jgi:hypothetical protein